jgi:hypothetical protein
MGITGWISSMIDLVILDYFFWECHRVICTELGVSLFKDDVEQLVDHIDVKIRFKQTMLYKISTVGNICISLLSAYSHTLYVFLIEILNSIEILSGTHHRLLASKHIWNSAWYIFFHFVIWTTTYHFGC